MLSYYRKKLSETATADERITTIARERITMASHSFVRDYADHHWEFERIYSLAKEKDVRLLAYAKNENCCLGVYLGPYTVIALLAEEGDRESVEFLINTLNANRNEAVRGYAMGGHVARVNELIAQGASRDDAAWGYAYGGYVAQVNEQIAQGASRNSAVGGYAHGGHVLQVNQQIAQGASRNCAVIGYARACYIEQVEELIAQGASRDDAVWGYARGGHVEQVNKQIAQGASRDDAVDGYARGGHIKLIDLNDPAIRDVAVHGFARSGYVDLVNVALDHGASRNEAVKGYATGGHVEQVNHEIAQGASRNEAVKGYAIGGYIEHVNREIAQGASREEAVRGYAIGDYLEQKSLFRLMALTDDSELRRLLAEEAQKENKALDVNVLLEKATRIIKIMREYKLDFKQAQSLTIPGMRGWLLQGPLLARNNIILLDIYFLITFFVSGLSRDDTKKVFTAVNRILLTGSVEKLLNNFKFEVISVEKYSEEHQIAIDHHNKRYDAIIPPKIILPSDKLRKAIECNDDELFLEILSNNPALFNTLNEMSYARQNILETLHLDNKANLVKALFDFALESPDDRIKEMMSWPKRHGITVLHSAVYYDHLPASEYCIKKFPDSINALTDSKSTPLHYAAFHGYKDGAEILLFPPQVRGEDGWDFQGYQEGTERFLVRRDINLDQQDKDGNTALHEALRKNYPKLVKLLCNAGANFELKNCDGKTSFDLAKHNLQLMDIFFQKDPDAVLEFAIETNNAELFLEILWNNLGFFYFLNKMNYARQNILETLHLDGKANLVKALFDYALESPDDRIKEMMSWPKRHGITVLHGAVYCEHLAAIKYCVEKFPDSINAITDSKSTPLHYAASQGYIEGAKLLLAQCHINLYQQDKDGNTALEYAWQKKRFELFKLFFNARKKYKRYDDDNDPFVKPFFLGVLSFFPKKNPGKKEEQSESKKTEEEQAESKKTLGVDLNPETQDKKIFS